MELVYVWIREHKGIKEQGYNFSSRFHCEFFYDKENLEITKTAKHTLNITKKEDISIFPDNINVTAIVGKNGSGKSSLMDVLFHKFNPDNNIFIIFDKTQRKLNLFGCSIKNYSHSIGIHDDSSRKTNATYEILEEDFNRIFDVEFENNQNINLFAKDLKSIFYSDLPNDKSMEIPFYYQNEHYSHSVDISTYHLFNQVKLLGQVHSNEINIIIDNAFEKIFKVFKVKQIQQAVVALQDGFIPPFNPPEKLFIKNIATEQLQYNFIDNEKVYIKNIIDTYNNKEKTFINTVELNLLITLLSKNQDSNNPIYNELLTMVANNGEYSQVKQVIYGYGFNIEGYGNGQAGYVDDFFNNADKLLKTIESLPKERNGVIEINVKDIDQEILKIYEQLVQQTSYFWDIGWRGLSSGEEVFLYQFSRFYNLNLNLKEDPYSNLKVENKEAKNLFILIDEGEISLHPEWQRCYIKYLVEFFQNNYFKDGNKDRTIHLILTSHSPFVLSDIPKEHVVFLDNFKQMDEFKNSQTFGANIHNLLSHGFFMENGLIGEYAKEKINEVIKILNEGELTKENAEKQAYCQNIINLIGEPILKRELQRMYDSHFSESDKEQRLEKQIEELQKELDKLKSQNNV